MGVGGTKESTKRLKLTTTKKTGGKKFRETASSFPKQTKKSKKKGTTEADTALANSHQLI